MMILILLLLLKITWMNLCCFKKFWPNLKQENRVHTNRGRLLLDLVLCSLADCGVTRYPLPLVDDDVYHSPLNLDGSSLYNSEHRRFLMNFYSILQYAPKL